VFSVVYDVMPAVVLGQWKGVEVEVPDVSIGDEDINRELEVIRERNAIVLDKDDAAAAVKDDVVTVNYGELADTGEIAAGTAREDFVFTLGSGHNIFKFDDAVLGMKKGETRDIEKTYPEDFEDKELAGKTKKIRVTLTALKEKKLPDLDDELAQDVDEKYKTLEDLKGSIQERLSGELERRLRSLKINKILEKAMETSPVDVPESMIRFQLDTRKRTMARNMNVSVDVVSNILERSGGQWLDTWRPEAIKALHSRLIVETIIKELGFEVTEEEVEKRIETIALESGSSVEELKTYYEKEVNVKSMLEEDLKEEKLFDLLLSENIIKVGNKVNYLEFTTNNG
jgi:trigger factor